MNGHDGACSLAVCLICDCECRGKRHGERYKGKLGPDRRDLTYAQPTWGFVEDPDLACPSCNEDLEGLAILRTRKWSVIWNGVKAKKALEFVICENCDRLLQTSELGL